MTTQHVEATVDVMLNEASIEHAAMSRGLDPDQLQAAVSYVIAVVNSLPVRAPEAGILEVGGVRFSVGL